MHFLPNHSPARPAHMAAEEATHVSPRSVVSQGRGNCVSGPSLTIVLLQRPSHSWRCSCQLRMLAASSSLRRNVGSRWRKSVIWGTVGHEAWSSSVPQARCYKTCPDIPLVRAGHVLHPSLGLALLPSTMAEVGIYMIVVSYKWALWLPFSFDSSVGVGSLGPPRAPSLAQDLVQE